MMCRILAKKVVMKTENSKLLMLALLGAALWVCTGCNEQQADAEEVPVVAGPALPVAAEADDVSANAAAPAEGTNTVRVVKPAELPDAVKISPALQQLAKLVQAGLHEGVIRG